MTCSACGTTYIAAGTSCPTCGGFGKSGNADILRKTHDEPDLKKGW